MRTGIITGSTVLRIDSDCYLVFFQRNRISADAPYTIIWILRSAGRNVTFIHLILFSNEFQNEKEEVNDVQVKIKCKIDSIIDRLRNLVCPPPVIADVQAE
jgi:hypothetical protein